MKCPYCGKAASFKQALQGSNMAYTCPGCGNESKQNRVVAGLLSGVGSAVLILEMQNLPRMMDNWLLISAILILSFCTIIFLGWKLVPLKEVNR